MGRSSTCHSDDSDATASGSRKKLLFVISLLFIIYKDFFLRLNSDLNSALPKCHRIADWVLPTTFPVCVRSCVCRSGFCPQRGVRWTPLQTRTWGTRATCASPAGGRTRTDPQAPTQSPQPNQQPSRVKKLSEEFSGPQKSGGSGSFLPLLPVPFLKGAGRGQRLLATHPRDGGRPGPHPLCPL